VDSVAKVDLAGVRAKIARAREHGEALKGEVGAYFESGPYKLAKNVNADHTLWTITIDILREPPELRWAGIFGDAVHNLRTALDYLFCAVAERHADNAGITDRRRGSWKFPITGHLTGLAGVRWKQCKGAEWVPDAVWAAIEREQPYSRVDPVEAMLVTLLGELDLTDKHRQHLILCAPYPYHRWENLQGARGWVAPVIEVDALRGAKGLESGAEIAWVSTQEPSPNMNPKFTVRVFVSLAEAPAWPLPVLLDRLSEHVEGIVERIVEVVV